MTSLSLSKHSFPKYSLNELIDKIQSECAMLSHSFLNISKLMSNSSYNKVNDIKHKRTRIGQKRKREESKHSQQEEESKPISLLVEDFTFDVNSEHNDKGDFIKITANNKHYYLGPYDDSEFVESIKKDIQRCLSTVNNIKTFEESLEELKQMIYMKFPPIDEDKYVVTNS